MFERGLPGHSGSARSLGSDHNNNNNSIHHRENKEEWEREKARATVWTESAGAIFLFVVVLRCYLGVNKAKHEQNEETRVAMKQGKTALQTDTECLHASQLFIFPADAREFSTPSCLNGLYSPVLRWWALRFDNFCCAGEFAAPSGMVFCLFGSGNTANFVMEEYWNSDTWTNRSALFQLLKAALKLPSGIILPYGSRMLLTVLGWPLSTWIMALRNKTKWTVLPVVCRKLVTFFSIMLPHTVLIPKSWIDIFYCFSFFSLKQIVLIVTYENDRISHHSFNDKKRLFKVLKFGNFEKGT